MTKSDDAAKKDPAAADSADDVALHAVIQNALDKKKAAAKAIDEYAICRPWKEYSIDDVIADLKAYHDVCSFYYSLQLAIDKIKESATEINKDLDAIYKVAKKDAEAGKKPASATAGAGPETKGDKATDDGNSEPPKKMPGK